MAQKQVNRVNLEHLPNWKHYLLIFRDTDGRYTMEFENEFTYYDDRAVVSRLKVYIPQSFIASAGRDQALKLVRKTFAYMKRIDPESQIKPTSELLVTFRRIVRRIKVHLYREYKTVYKDLHLFFQFFFEQLSSLLRALWLPSRREYLRSKTMRRLIREEDAILSQEILYAE